MKNIFSNLNPFNWKSKNNQQPSSSSHSFNSLNSTLSSGQKYPGGLPNHGFSNLIANKRVRQNARNAFHDSPEGKAIVNRFADTVVDTGLVLECTPEAEILGISRDEAEEWARDTERRFNLWGKSKQSDRRGLNNFYQTQRLYQISQQRDNDLFVRFYYSKSKDLMNPLQLSIMDPNQIKGSSLTSTFAFSSLHDGINRNSQGEEISYNIFSRDESTGEVKDFTVPRVGASSKKIFMIHAFSAEYAGQKRGYSRLEHFLQELNDVTDFKLSGINKAIAQSQMTMYVKPSQDNDASNPLEDFTTASGPLTNSNLAGVETPPEDIGCPVGFDLIPEVQFRVPGTTGVFSLKKGEDLVPFPTQAASESYNEFIESYMSYISASNGIPIEVLLMKFGENYSASRGALLLFWRVVLIWRGEMESDFLNPTYESWLSEEIGAGRIIAPGFSDPILRNAWLSNRWIGAPMPNIDPQRTAKAEQLYVEMGATNLDRVARDYNGSDGATNRQKLKKQMEELTVAKWNEKIIPPPTSETEKDDDEDN